MKGGISDRVICQAGMNVALMINGDWAGLAVIRLSVGALPPNIYMLAGAEWTKSYWTEQL